MAKMRLVVRLGIIAATSRSTRVLYDRVCPFYEALFTDHLCHIQNMATALCKEFAVKDGVKVLDLACGTGILSRRLEEQGFCVTGVDFSFQSLCSLKQKMKSIRVIQADASALPFESGSFDVVTCMGAWRHFADPQQVLHEVSRILRRDGIFLVGYFPPKLGGLLTIPKGRLGKTIVSLYGRVTRLLNYTDKADQDMERLALRIIETAFSKHYVIQSGKGEYLIFARSPL
jgi:ubiquinone/menaquinone biosynthesis C-methylase UbiE